jgi:signal peptidase I
VTRPRHLRSGLLSAALVVLAVLAWLLLAPTSIGGESSYVTTSGTSMAPRFHTGDLAVVRAAKDYRVGQIVAYRSALLHRVVLHRIIARRGDRYVLKGDNNDFIDPTHPTHAEVIGRLSLRVAQGGRVLSWLHSPGIAAVLSGGTALLLLLGAGRHRRRRDRRRPPEARARRERGRSAAVRLRDALRSGDGTAAFIACAVAAAAFGALGVLAFARPASRPTTVKTPYTERVAFGYHADAPVGPVYPAGTVKTGDPIFLRLVHRVRVKVHYRLAAAAPHRVSGTVDVLIRLTSPNGWSRTVQVASPASFTGDYASAAATLDLRSLQALIRRVEAQTGAPAGGGYSLAVQPRLHVTGTLAGQALTSDFAPSLSFQMDALQLRLGAGAPASGEQSGGLTPSRRGSVASPSATANALSVRGHGLGVVSARWIALAGFLLAAAATLLTGVRLLRQPWDPASRIRARYRHLIVPIAGTAYEARPPIDVASIEALVQLAERSERLILHHEPDGVDTYLVDDEGTLYRYQAGPAVASRPAASSARDGHLRQVV